jgi:hypothetical protein
MQTLSFDQGSAPAGIYKNFTLDVASGAYQKLVTAFQWRAAPLNGRGIHQKFTRL